MSKLLINEEPLQVLPSLAELIGLNEALFLQQVHYWLNRSNHLIKGKKWIYNTYEDWQKQFPFWSNATIRRTISSLENKGLLIHDNFNKAGFDKTKWYTIHYQLLESMSRPSAQNEQTMCSNWTDGVAQDEQTNTKRITQENTTREVDNNAFSFYQQNFGLINGFIAEDIQHWLDDLNEELVIEAMKRTLEQQKKWSYAKGILANWKNLNFKTIQDVHAADVEFKNRKKPSNRTIRTEIVPDWLNPQEQPKESPSNPVDVEQERKRLEEEMKMFKNKKSKKDTY